jgi:uncharacterized Tic20 family protein
MSEQTETHEPNETPEQLDRTVRNWAMGCHMIALVGLLGNGIGLVVGPLILWLIKREDHPFIDEQGKEAVNFQITMCIALFISALLIFVAIGLFLLPVVAILDVVLTIVAALKAADGEHYRYPFAIRFLK